MKRRQTVFRRRRGLGGAYFGQVQPVTFPSSPLTTRVYIALGADLTASYLSWNWLDITSRVRHDLGISIVAGRRDERSQVTPSRCQIKVDNNDGALCRRNPFSPYYGLLTRNTPIWIQLNPGSGFVDRYFGYINEWPTTWADESGTDTTVTIQCAGVMRRLAQGRSLKSPVFRTFSGVAPNDYIPHAYWPMEDGSSATQFASAIPGHPAMTVTGAVNFAANSAMVGSDPLSTFSAAATATAIVPAYAATTQWVVMFTMLVPSQPASKTTFMEISVPGATETLWRLVVDPIFSPDFVTLETYDSAGASVNFPLITQLNGGSDWEPSESQFYGTWATYFIASVDIGGGVLNHNSGLSIGAEMRVTGNLGTFDTHGSIAGIKLYGGNGASFGHVAVYTDPSFAFFGGDETDASNNSAAVFGWDGEQAHNRVKRLCREEGVHVVALAGESAAMGPQGSGTLLAELRACETADQGVLYEHQFGIGYQALSERYNQYVTLNLDFDSGHHAGVPTPADDDQRLINKFTASRTNGSSATAEETTGTLGTGAGGSGVFDDSATVNVESDAQLADYASWKVHLGTVDEDRWPSIPFQLHANPSLIPGWLSTPYGARINVANPPSQMDPDTIDAIIEGYTEGWNDVAWAVALNTSPASPYRIFTLDDAALGLIDSATSTLAVEVAAGASSMTVATSSAADLWSTDAGDVPLTVQIAGIDVTVTGISGASSPQTFTVTAATVTKTLPANSTVELANPTYLGR